jgi:hypothetical protein
MYSLGDLQTLLSVLYGQYSPQDQEKADEQLTALREDPAILPFCVEIINSIPDGLLSFFAATTIIHHLFLPSSAFSREDLTAIFKVCFDRLDSDRNVLNSVTERKTIECMSIISAAFLPEFLSGVTFPVIGQTVVFLDSTYFVLSHYRFEPSCDLYEYATGPLLLVVAEVLGAAEVSETWFSLHSRAISFATDFHPFDPLLPRIKQMSTTPKHIPGLLDLFENVLCFEPINLAPEQLRYIVDLMRIVVGTARWLLAEGGNVAQASFVWTVIMDYSVDFFTRREVVPFAQRVFGEFIQSLPRMGEDFSLLVEQAGNLFGHAASRDFANFGVFAARILTIISTFVTEEGHDFKDDRLEKAIAAITGWEIPSISEALIAAARTPSPGLFYVIAYSAKSIRAAVAESLVPHIGLTRSSAVLSFIARCCKYLEPFAGPLIELTYEMLSDHPAQGVEAVKSLARRFPRLFAEDIERYVLPLLEPLTSTTPDRAERIIAAIFYIFPEVPCEIPAEIWDRLGQLIVPFFEGMAAMGDLFAFRDFAIAILKGADPSKNPPFYHALVGSIVAIFRDAACGPLDLPLLLAILEVCLRQKVIDDPGPPLSLALEVLAECPAPEAFWVLARCPELVSPEHLQGIELGSDRRLQAAFLDFLVVYCEVNPEGFRQCVNPDWLLRLFDHHDDRITVAVLKTLNAVVRDVHDHEFLAHVLETVAQLLFQSRLNGGVSIGLKLLQTIAIMHVGFGPVLDALGAICGECPAWESFAVAFQGPADKKLAILANALVRDVRQRMVGPP